MADALWFDDRFGMLHRPGHGVRSTAVVLVAPLGYEAICAHRVLRHLAERLVRRGFAVLRYDHLGSGDSFGVLSAPGLLDGVGAACRAAQELSGARSAAVVALGAGALLARAGLSRVLWAPPADGRSYVREIKALSGFGRAAPGEAAGFVFPAALLGELAAWELDPDPARTLVLERDAAYEQAVCDPHQTRMPDDVLGRIVDWLDRRHPELGADRPRREPCSEHRGERAVHFGDDHRLFGVVTRAQTPSDRPCVLWLNPGAIHRIGMNRNYVGFARALAERGVGSLRFDVSGIGDSPALPGMSENLLYSTHVVPDVRAAMDFLERERMGQRFVLAGLCSGAYAAFHSALADDRVCGAILVNPQTFDYRPGDGLEVQQRNSYRATRWYRRSALSAESWKKALRGQVDLMRIARAFADRGVTLIRRRLAPPPERRSQAAAMRNLLSRARLLLVYSADDPGLDHLRAELGSELEKLERIHGFELEVVSGPDHTFTPVWSQRVLEALVQRHLLGESPASVPSPSRSSALASAARRRAKQAAAAVAPPSLLVVRGPRRSRRIALTFDDGPTELSEHYLRVLERLGVRATFFLVGRALAQLPRAAGLVAEAGHELGGHGFSHTIFPRLDPRGLRSELERTDALLPGPKNGRRLVRPPHGAVSARSLLECARAGFTTVLWSYDSGDSCSGCASELLGGIARRPPAPGDIVLLHEDHRHTLEALPEVVQRLRSAGYELVTVGDLLRPHPAL